MKPMLIDRRTGCEVTPGETLIVYRSIKCVFLGCLEYGLREHTAGIRVGVGEEPDRKPVNQYATKDIAPNVYGFTWLPNHILIFTEDSDD